MQGPKGFAGAGTGVRALVVPNVPPDFAVRHGGRGEAVVLSRRADIEARFGRPVADAVEGRIDRSREVPVFVGWTTSGPPEGVLIHSVARTTTGATVTFRVRAPRGALIRGTRARIGADWFAVPRGWKVLFDANERP